MKGVKVIGGGMTYTPLLLSPSDMQYLETQKFDTTLLSRLFGIPPKHMLAESGSSLTYSNVEQEWSQFADFTLNAYAEHGDTTRPDHRFRLGLVPPFGHENPHGDLQDRYRGRRDDRGRSPLKGEHAPARRLTGRNKHR